MTTAEIILSACAIAGLIFTAIAWIYGFGRQAGNIKATDERVDALTSRTDSLEADVQKIGEIKQELKAHAELTGEKFESMRQQSRDGFERVAGEIRAFDRLMTMRLDEITHRLRDPGVNRP